MNEKDETRRKKYNVSLLTRNFSDEISPDVADEKPATNPNQPHKLDCIPEVEEKPNGNLESKGYFEKLPDEIVENILVLATTTTRQTPETYHSLVQTCKRFSTILERRKRKFSLVFTYSFPMMKLKSCLACVVNLKSVFEKP